MNGLLSKYGAQDGNEILFLGRVETLVRETRSVSCPSARRLSMRRGSAGVNDKDQELQIQETPTL
jgi:hypothetical protein